MVMIELRLYRRFDADLLSLVDEGVSLTDLARRAVIAYARGETLRFIPARCKLSDPHDKENCHLRVTIKDPKAERLLRQIKRGYKCQFVKTLIRQTLLEQSLGPFFIKTYAAEAEQERLDALLENREEIGTAINGTAEVLKYKKEKRNRQAEILRAPKEDREDIRTVSRTPKRKENTNWASDPSVKRFQPAPSGRKADPREKNGPDVHAETRKDEEKRTIPTGGWNDGFSMGPKRFRPDVNTVTGPAGTPDEPPVEATDTASAEDTESINREFLDMFDNM